MKVIFPCECKHHLLVVARWSENAAKGRRDADGGICVHLAMVSRGARRDNFGWSISNFAIFGELTLDRTPAVGGVEWRTRLAGDMHPNESRPPLRFRRGGRSPLAVYKPARLILMSRAWPAAAWSPPYRSPPRAKF